MKEDTYESGECTDDSFSNSSLNTTLHNQDLSKYHRKILKKKRKHRNCFSEISKHYKSLKNHYFNPYIFQRIENNKKWTTTSFTRTSKSLTDIGYVERIKKTVERQGKFKEPRFLINKIDLKSFEYTSFVKYDRKECYSPDPDNPIKINLKSNLTNYKGNTKTLENYFDIINKNQIIITPKSVLPLYSEQIDSAPCLNDILLIIGIRKNFVEDLMKIIYIENKNILSNQNEEFQNVALIENGKESTDDDMDISEDEFDNLGIVVENIRNSEINNLNELISKNSLYMSDYSPEHISYHEFVTNFGVKHPSNEIIYDTLK